jgi:hypothetical protein
MFQNQNITTLAQENTERISFSRTKIKSTYPDFLNIQIQSFQDFFQLETNPEDRVNEGLYKVFSENFPISDSRNNFVLEFLEYFIDPPRYSIDECFERGLSYSVPLKAKLKLYCTDPEHEDFETIIQDVYLGQIPYMTPRGTFVINGAERVIVSQLHRSPGVFFGTSFHANGQQLFSARIIPFRGSWMEFTTNINNVMYAYIDRKKKLPVTTLLRAIGFESDKDILEIFDLAQEIKATKANLKKVVGSKLAARVVRAWIEDFVDEDILGDYYFRYYDEDHQLIGTGPEENSDAALNERVEPGFIPRPTDQRFRFSMFFQDYFPTNPTYKMHLALYFGSSLPFGPPKSARYQQILRMPPYRRVDIGFSKQIIGERIYFPKNKPIMKISSLWLSLEVFNLLQVSNTISYVWVTDVTGVKYAVPNYLTPRQLNIKLVAHF